MFDDLITLRDAPPKRTARCEGGIEHHLTEGAVMLAFAMHLLRTVPGIQEIAIHPDGEHGKRFDFESWLGKQGLRKISGTGRTSYGGTYRSQAGVTLIVHPASGLGDVVAKCGNGLTWIAECKGGIINTRHPGQVSRLRKVSANPWACHSQKPSRTVHGDSQWCRTQERRRNSDGA